MEIKNKLIDSDQGEEEGDNREKKRKGSQGTCIKDTWSKTIRGGRIECGSLGG